MNFIEDKVFNTVIEEYARLPQVQAAAIGGSNRANTSDLNSDIDIYIFINEEISVNKRLEIIKKYSSKYEAGGDYFGPGDEFFVDEMKCQMDVMFFDRIWIENEIEKVWIENRASNGYSTCFLFTVKNCEILYDKNEWLKNLKRKLETPYPKILKQNIIKRNMMLLKDKPFSSYYEQIEKALIRKDFNSVNHRIAAFMASYFDIIFAVNELLHPGEKKLVEYARRHCDILPEDFGENIEKLLTQPNSDTLYILKDMVFKLKKCAPEI